jgi:alkylhydroperoxidase/carboxymuconolactone decarboxylase family protein YurZ
MKNFKHSKPPRQKDSFLFPEELTHFGGLMSLNPLDAYREFDPKLIEHYEKLQNLSYSEGTLSAKFKLLIALAIDVEHGSVQGANAIGRRALKMGATKEEIIETLRIAYQIGGNRALFTSAQVLQILFK